MGGVGGAGEGGAVWEDVEGLHGGCVCAEGWRGEPLRDGVGDDYVHGGEGGSGEVDFGAISGSVSGNPTYQDLAVEVVVNCAWIKH